MIGRRSFLIPERKPVAVETELDWLTAVRAAESKKAQDIKVLDLRDVTSFTDYFIICTGTNSRQNQAVSDEIHMRMKQTHGDLPTSVEGYEQGEWILMDYGNFIVHIFLDRARSYYDLERLWRGAKEPAILQLQPAGR
jgi:ribosome-associated protein